MNRIVYIVLGCFLWIACTDQTREKVKEQQLYDNPKDNAVSFTVLYEVAPQYQEKIKDWKGFGELDVLLFQLTNATPNDVLLKSDEFLVAAQEMEQNIPNPLLNTPAVKARINGVYSQVLKINDLKYVPSIQASIVISETKELYRLFDILKMKINAVFEQEKNDAAMDAMMQNVDDFKF